MNIGIARVMAGTLTAVITVAAADAAPQQMLNKTVLVQWGESLVEQTPDGRTIAPNLRHSRTIYISSAGRTFVKSQAMSRGAGREGASGPDSDSAGSWTFQGNTLLGTFENIAVARRITVSFDASGSGCNATVVVGKRGAHPKWMGVDGVTYELMQDNVGTVNCSISNGNAFAGH
jgi:hypothetical protein